MTSNTGSGRRANLALLLLIPTTVLSGLFANTIGVDWRVDPAAVHGIVALAMLLTTPWKAGVIRRGAARRRSTRWMSWLLVALALTTLGSGLIHATDVTDRVGPLTVMQIHVGGGLIVLTLLVAHYRSHPVKPRPQDLSRRNLLRSLGLAGAATVIWAGWEQAISALDLDGAERRFTGSHERSSFDQRGMPVTQWFDDRVQHIERSDWALEVDGSVFEYEAVAQLEREPIQSVLDCTSGWYSEQLWEGVRLDALIDPRETRSIEVRSATGYARRFPVRDLAGLWLVTHVNGETLTAGHGFPARIVAPGRRGFWWVKWVVQIRSSRLPWWVQSPFPLT